MWSASRVPTRKSASIVLALAVVLVSMVLGPPATGASTTIYKGPAKRLIPTAAEAGFDRITSQSSSTRRATASYEGSYTSGSGPGITTGTIGVRVFPTEAAAKASYDGACAGCEPRSFNKWKYKRGFQLATDQRNRIVTLVAYCRNLTVETVRTAIDSKEHLTRVSKLMIDEAVFSKAVNLGMTPCGATATPPPTGKYFWTESQADAIVLRKLYIPYCTVYPSDPECRGKIGVGLRSVECRGLDEKPGTFTYSRFSCDVILFGINVRARIAVWPTGPTTFRWQII